MMVDSSSRFVAGWLRLVGCSYLVESRRIVSQARQGTSARSQQRRPRRRGRQ